MRIAKKLSVATIGAAFIALLPSVEVEAATINQVNPAELTSTSLLTFEDIAGGPLPGTNYNAILEYDGVNFAERFAGQTLSSNGGLDVLSGTPTGPLTLQAGNLGQNFAVLIDTTTPNTTNALLGLGPIGFPSNSALGEGSFAVLFNVDQSEIGFDLFGGNGGSATVNFFSRNGSLVDSIVLNSLSLNNTPYGFSRDGGIEDIAGFSIYNNDLQGAGLDNLRYDAPGSPTPIPFDFSPGLGLLLLGAWGAIAQLNSLMQKRKVFGRF